ncbi:MAG TPA: hypothetical protein VKZ96_09845 [Thermomicrobiales bacterium]|nr:hypothetical protein [Thermomicrobiales bacterium]
MGRGVEMVSAWWYGPRWRWWSLLLGILLIPLSALAAALVSALTGDDLIPLLLLFLIIEILFVSLLGSGFLRSLTDKLIRGGLARDSTEFVDRVENASDLESMEKREQAARDELTIRAALIVLPLIAAFIYFMTQL